MANIEIRPSIRDDITTIANNLRDIDRFEIESAYQLSPEIALLFTLQNSSTCNTILLENKPVGIFGVTSNPGFSESSACVFFVATKEISKIKKMFVKMGKIYISEFLKKYDLLFNWVHEKNIDSVLWLSSLGALIYDPSPYGINGEPFRYFEIRR